MTDIIYDPPPRLDAERALALLQGAFREERPDYVFEDLANELMHNPHAGVWVGQRSAVFLRVKETPTTGEIILEASPAAGDLDEVLSAGATEIEQIARNMGATQIHVRAGRQGWVKALAPLGYEVSAVILRKVLD